MDISLSAADMVSTLFSYLVLLEVTDEQRELVLLLLEVMLDNDGGL